LKKGKCTTEKVRCVMTNCKLELTQEQFDELCSKYTLEDGMFNFKAMCDSVEDPSTNPCSGEGPLRNSIVLTNEEKAYNKETMNHIKSMCVKGRIDPSEILADFDQTKRGHIPHTQFFRALQTIGLNRGAEDGKDIAMLALSFTNNGAPDLVDYRAFMKELDAMEFKGRSSMQ